MARIMDGIKELLGKGKDDDDELAEYRRGYDQRQSPGSNRNYGYPANATSDVRSGYRRPYGEALDDNYIRNGYDTRASPRGAEYRRPYGISESSPRGIEYASPRSIEYASPRSIEYASPRGTEYRRPYVGSEVASPRGDYVRAPLESPRNFQRSPRGSRHDSNDSVIEFMVPMCCDKCEEKVKEELGEVEGVKFVRCDPANSRVIVTGDDSIDVERCLKKAERAVKKKCELISTDAGAGTRDSGRYYSAMDRSNGTSWTGIRDGTREGSRVALVSPSGRPTLGRLPSFASGKVTQYDGVGPRGQDYDARDYNGSGFRRMPSFGTHRHNEAEYVTSYDQRPEPLDSRREVYTVRRMPSFNKHKHHDAEYLSAGDREYSPRTFYESNAGSMYTTAYNERPVYRSQVSFSKLPVENPNYVKHITY